MIIIIGGENKKGVISYHNERKLDIGILIMNWLILAAYNLTY